jgi:ubiquinone biosynthesis protein
VSFGNILVRLFEISRRFNMEVQPQLILLQKTLLNVEGLGRDLYPELDIWQTASPILREWMRERLSLRQVLHDLRRQMPELIEVARSIPAFLNGAVQRARGGNLRLEVSSADIESLREEIRQSSRRRDAIPIGAAILLGGLIWVGLAQGEGWPGWALTAFGAMWLVLAGRRRS